MWASPELLDTHRPDAFRMRDWGRRAVRPIRVRRMRLSPFLALRIFRPRARRAWQSRRTARASSWPKASRGKMLDLAGPWRTSGDWWTADPWERDEWDVALSDGALYRIYCEPAGAGSWKAAID